MYRGSASIREQDVSEDARQEVLEFQNPDTYSEPPKKRAYYANNYFDSCYTGLGDKADHLSQYCHVNEYFSQELGCGMNFNNGLFDTWDTHEVCTNMGSHVDERCGTDNYHQEVYEPVRTPEELYNTPSTQCGYINLDGLLNRLTMIVIREGGASSFSVPQIPLGNIGSIADRNQHVNYETTLDTKQAPPVNKDPPENWDDGINAQLHVELSSYLANVPKYPGGGEKWQKIDSDRSIIPQRDVTPMVHKLLEEGYDVRLGERGRSLLKKEISRRFRQNHQLREDCLRYVCRLKNANVIQLLAMSELTGCFIQCLQITNDYWLTYSERRKSHKADLIDNGQCFSPQSLSSSTYCVAHTPLRRGRGRVKGRVRRKKRGFSKTQNKCKCERMSCIMCKQKIETNEDNRATAPNTNASGMSEDSCDDIPWFDTDKSPVVKCENDLGRCSSESNISGISLRLRMRR